MHEIADKAEVTIDFPDKFYMGSFGRDCSFEAHAENDGVMIRLQRSGSEQRNVEIHLHHLLFANILADLAASLAAREPIDNVHRPPLLAAARQLATAIERPGDQPPPG